MKNVIILLLCLSLLLCSGCQAAANNTGTEPTAAPTVAPTVAPTQEPTQEPTQAPTEPPALVAKVDAEVKFITYEYYTYNAENPIDPVSPLLHSADEINAYILAQLQKGYPDVNFPGYDWSQFDAEFFKENSVIVLLADYVGGRGVTYSMSDIYLAADGGYYGAVAADYYVWNDLYMHAFSLGILIMKGVTDDGPVHIEFHY